MRMSWSTDHRRRSLQRHHLHKVQQEHGRKGDPCFARQLGFLVRIVVEKIAFGVDVVSHLLDLLSLLGERLCCRHPIQTKLERGGYERRKRGSSRKWCAAKQAEVDGNL